MSVVETVEFPVPLIRIVTTGFWKSAGWTGYREFTCTISVGDVVLMERKADDEEDYNMCESLLRERTVNEFGNRLKEVLGL